MRKRGVLMLLVVAAVVMLVGVTFSACGFFGGDDDNTPENFTIQYADELGQHVINVTRGDVYRLEHIPYKAGYTFLGLYDAESGGTQYVDSAGLSVGSFRDSQNLVLYPQFAPIQYSLQLHYGNAIQNGSAFFMAAYGEELPALPGNVILDGEHAFVGWFTGEDCSGVQVAGQMGFAQRKFDDELVSLATDGTLHLYAGFKKLPAKHYHIQYSVDGTIFTQEVVENENYSLTELPSKIGFTFLGLFGDEDGGTQYVTSDGMSLRPFTDGQNVTLFARFERKTYTFVLDYGGADVSYDDEFEVEFEGRIPDLPGDLVCSDKTYLEFEGWFTQQDRGGEKLTNADGKTNGLRLESGIARLANEQNIIFLYAGYDRVKYTVRFLSQNGSEVYASKSCEHGTRLSQINFYKKVGNGLVRYWSEQKGGAALDGDYEIVGATDFYACAAEQAKGKYGNYNERVITDDGYGWNYSDNVNLSSILNWGLTMSDLRALGFTKVVFTLKIKRSEINDGYQDIRVVDSGNGGVLATMENLEMGGMWSKVTTPREDSWIFTVDIGRVSNTVRVEYDAHGGMDDDWCRHFCELEFRVE